MNSKLIFCSKNKCSNNCWSDSEIIFHNLEKYAIDRKNRGYLISVTVAINNLVTTNDRKHHNIFTKSFIENYIAELNL